jgi:ribosomal protein S18 acetylase RimI-like enzyme
MEIKSLAKTDFETIFKAFNQAFADYEMQLNSEQLFAMLKRRGYNPDLSFAAFENDEIVSFVFNGIGDFYGIQTAYDTGTGTLKEYRGQGLATKILEYSIPFLKEANIKQYILEVLQHNTKAVSVYRNVGSEVSREFNYFIQKSENIQNTIKSSETSYIIEKIDIEKYGFLSDFWDFYPSWQNSFESIKRASEGFVCLGVFAENKLVGYCVFEPISGDVTQLAVNKQHRRKGIASLLLNEIIKLNKSAVIRVINTDISCESITNFLKAKNMDVTGKQFEMIKKI